MTIDERRELCKVLDAIDAVNVTLDESMVLDWRALDRAETEVIRLFEEEEE